MNTPMQLKTGTLFVVATPVGNLEDITFRAVRVLKEVDLIAAEDTRHTARLLSHYNIKNSVISCHEHNELQRLDLFLEKLSQGQSIALVSDAGTPTISDPGYQLVKKVARQGFRVVPVPGPSAAIAGLSVSGLPSDSFLFMGFLHRKKGRRQSALEGIKNEKATLIFYESPRRIIILLEELMAILGDRPAMVAREITKIHEEFLRGTLSQIIEILKSRPSVKGECAIFVAWEPPEPVAVPTGRDMDHIISQALADSDESPARIAKHLSRKLNCPRKEIYQRLITLKRN
ncbi:16S rRNA (cytidine1402-2'-O)-methyltransferase [Desulfocicer vacuolatum DSM 3385]|uniref:Ribosomal RNA small subunit methyltransferase I n=1 Tax=Desulfocicer vacuolatum DSM 3385 TaxID=1121400 RepID=A0A1W2CSC9_9BACT|nr:16S rRNA (cytidine(1402)-2'-O)-methyltransferase [Desulfocicer vacuolatum]SMC88130.1 16S rRNA (cytidine1402-2'-O)-methyltransferase [Desulfocicer vacuolatum DSM 3385]